MTSIDEDEDLRLVDVIVAVCGKCGGAFHLVVKTSMTRKTSRAFAKYLESGDSVYTTNVIVARTLRWCDETCEGLPPIVIKRKKKV